MIKALVLFSGGLDSTLSALLLKEQGIYVKALYFYTGFCTTEFKRRLGVAKENPALKSASQIGIPIDIVDISDEYYKVVLNPKFGYGKNVNPCVDCRILMLKKAKEIMEREGYHFVATGEVLGQRPMSQTRQKLEIIEKESGLEGYLLRPLSAKLLPPTIPERMGWVNRDLLMDIKGRSRKKQIELAKRYSIEYQQPAGGCCYLTDENYAYRFREAINVEISLSREDLFLLAVGRHFRLPSGVKVILARNEGEVKFLKGFKNRYIHTYRKDGKGTFAIIKGKPTQEDLQTIGSLVAYYSKREPCDVVIRMGDEEIELFAHPLEPENVEELIVSIKPKASNYDQVHERYTQGG